MSLDSFLHQLSLFHEESSSPVILMHDNARSPACPMSAALTQNKRQRRRNSVYPTQRSRGSRPWSVSASAVEQRWQAQSMGVVNCANSNAVHSTNTVSSSLSVTVVSTNFHHQSVDVALRMPRRSQSYEFSEDMLQSVIDQQQQGTKDAAPILPSRRGTAVPFMTSCHGESWMVVR